MSVLELISYSFSIKGFPLLKDIHLSVSQGDIIGISGPSGSGKSIFLKSILRINEVVGSEESGMIIMAFGGKKYDLKTTADLNKLRINGIGYIIQKTKEALNPVQTIEKQLLARLKLRSDFNPSEAKDEIIELLKNVELQNVERIMNAYPHQLSGGQIQRVLIGLALINKPSLILADEPFSALDEMTKHNLVALLKKYLKDNKASLLWVSHDKSLLQKESDVCYELKGAQLGLLTRPNMKSIVIKNAKQSQTSILIELRQIRKAYKSQKIFKNESILVDAINDFDLKIRKGEILGICGSSGSGKTTLGKILCGIESIEAGTLLWKGEEVQSMDSKPYRQYKRSVFLINQDNLDSLPPHLTIGNYLEDIEKSMRSDSQLKKELLSKFRLEESLLNRYPSALSGGQRQRILILSAILLEVELMVCDEIFASLDDEIGEEILKTLFSLNTTYELSLIFISHKKGRLEKYCDRVIQLSS